MDFFVAALPLDFVAVDDFVVVVDAVVSCITGVVELAAICPDVSIAAADVSAE